MRAPLWLMGLLVLRFSVSGLQSDPNNCRLDGLSPEHLDTVTLYVVSADSVGNGPWGFTRKAVPALYSILIYNHPIFRFRYAWAATRDSAGNEQPRECSKIFVFPEP